MLLAVGGARQHLRETRRGDRALLIGIAAIEEVRLFEEVAALRVRAQGRNALAANQRLDLRRFRVRLVEDEVVIRANRLRERGQQTIVILRRDRIVLVIVTAGAADGQAEHGRADGAGHVVQFVIAFFLDLILGDLRAVNAGGQEAGRHQR